MELADLAMDRHGYWPVKMMVLMIMTVECKFLEFGSASHLLKHFHFHLSNEMLNLSMIRT